MALIVTGIFLVAAILAVAGVAQAFGAGSLARNQERAARAGHVADDSECVYWLGDFAGVNLRARCPICSPETKKK